VIAAPAVFKTAVSFAIAVSVIDKPDDEAGGSISPPGFGALHGDSQLLCMQTGHHTPSRCARHPHARL